MIAIPAVVVALALSELLTGWGRLLRTGAQVAFDPFLAGWSIFFVSSAAFLWLGNWGYRSELTLGPGAVIAMLLPPLLLFPIAVLLSPNPPERGRYSLREQYLRVARWLFPLAALYMASASLADWLVIGRFVAPGGALSFFYGAPLLVLAWTRALWLHAAMLVAGLLWQVGIIVLPGPPL